MHIEIPTTTDTLCFLISLIAGGGAGCLFVKYHIHNEARNALQKELQAIHDRIEKTETRAREIADEYVQCRFCDMQYSNVHSLLDSIDAKLNIILEKQMH